MSAPAFSADALSVLTALERMIASCEWCYESAGADPEPIRVSDTAWKWCCVDCVESAEASGGYFMCGSCGYLVEPDRIAWSDCGEFPIGCAWCN